MKKLFSKISALFLGLAMAIGAGAAVASNREAVPVHAATIGTNLAQVTSLTSGNQYVIVGNNNGYALPTNPTVSSGKITGTAIASVPADGSGYLWTFTKSGDYWLIDDSSKYIYHSNGGGSGTNLAYGTSTTYKWKLTYSTTSQNHWTFKGVNNTTENSRGMLVSGTNFGGYALSNESSYKYMNIYEVVAGKTPSSIAVTTPPNKTKYIVGDTLITDGMVVTGTYDDSSTDDVTSGCTCSPTLLNTKGTQIITVTHNASHLTATFTVEVIEDSSKDATYTVSSTTTVTPSGTPPTGSTASFVNTYTSTKDQVTKGNSMTLTLSGYSGNIIKGITLSMHSNGGAGAGTFSVMVGSDSIASISSATGFNKWYDNTSYGTDYRDVHVSLTGDNKEVQSGENVVITIACTTNSLYCQSFKIKYIEGTVNPVTSLTITGEGVTTGDSGVSDYKVTLFYNKSVTLTGTVNSTATVKTVQFAKDETQGGNIEVTSSGTVTAGDYGDGTSGFLKCTTDGLTEAGTPIVKTILVIIEVKHVTTMNISSNPCDLTTGPTGYDYALTIPEKTSTTISATYLPEDATIKKFTLSRESSATTHIEFNNTKHTLTARDYQPNGTNVIVVTCDGASDNSPISYRILVTVGPTPVSSLTITGEGVTTGDSGVSDYKVPLTYGSSVQLTGTVNTEASIKTVSFSKLEGNISVTNDGLVSALSYGGGNSGTVMCETDGTDQSGNKIQKTVKVLISPVPVSELSFNVVDEEQTPYQIEQGNIINVEFEEETLEETFVFVISCELTGDPSSYDIEWLVEDTSGIIDEETETTSTCTISVFKTAGSITVLAAPVVGGAVGLLTINIVDASVRRPIELTVTGTPNVQYVGNTFDYTNLTATATFNKADDQGHTTLDVTNLCVWNNGDVFTDDDVGDEITVTVSYTDSLSEIEVVDEITVEVLALRISSLYWINEPSKTTYYLNDSLDTTTFSVGGVYNSGYDIGNVTGDCEYDYDFTSTGTKTVTITLDDGELTFDVIVKMDIVMSVTITGTYKTSYTAGEKFDSTGLIVNAVYESGKIDENVQDYTLTLGGEEITNDFAMYSRYNTQLLVATYSGVSSSGVSISVEDKVIMSWKDSQKGSCHKLTEMPTLETGESMQVVIAAYGTNDPDRNSSNKNHFTDSELGKYYCLKHSNGGASTLSSGKYISNVLSVNNDEIDFGTETSSDYLFTLTKTDSGYTIGNNRGYVGGGSSTNLSENNTATNWLITETEKYGSFSIAQDGINRALCFNISSYNKTTRNSVLKFGHYATSNIPGNNGGYAYVELFAYTADVPGTDLGEYIKDTINTVFLNTNTPGSEGTYSVCGLCTESRYSVAWNKIKEKISSITAEQAAALNVEETYGNTHKTYAQIISMLLQKDGISIPENLRPYAGPYAPGISILSSINTLTIIIVIISLVSITSVGAYFYIRRKKEN